MRRHFIALVLLASGVAALWCGAVHAAPVEIEVAVFQGGFGIDQFERYAREYEKLRPDVKINLWGHPHVWEKLMPRFGAGDPPDVAWPGWGMNLWEIIDGGQLLAWDDLLQTPGYGTQKKWIDTFNPSIMKQMKYKGKYYILPYNIGAFGWYYNRKLFRENGWTPPQNYDELLVLCEKIKKKGIAPATFTGRYPQYPVQGMLLPWIVSAGGYEKYRATQNMEPGAWADEAVVKAAATIIDMKKRGNFQNGCIGMNHTESQMEFLVGRAAMVMSGTWFHSEMQNVLPAQFEAEFMLCPLLMDDKAGGSFILAGVDGQWVLSSKSKHPHVAADFLRYMTSPENSRRFMEAKDTLMSVETDREVSASEHLKEPLRLYLGSKGTIGSFSDGWYPRFSQASMNHFRDLYNEQITPEEYAKAMEREAEKIRRDPNQYRFTLE